LKYSLIYFYCVFSDFRNNSETQRSNTTKKITAQILNAYHYHKDNNKIIFEGKKS